jgi:hypothetical protein
MEISLIIPKAYEYPLRTGLEKEKTLFYTTFDMPDFKEGIAAHLEQRRPDFRHSTQVTRFSTSNYPRSPVLSYSSQSPFKSPTRVLSQEVAVFGGGHSPTAMASTTPGTAEALMKNDTKKVRKTESMGKLRKSESTRKRDSLLVRMVSFRAKEKT